MTKSETLDAQRLLARVEIDDTQDDLGCTLRTDFVLHIVLPQELYFPLFSTFSLPRNHVTGFHTHPLHFISSILFVNSIF